MRTGLKRYSVPVTNLETGETVLMEAEGYSPPDAQADALSRQFHASGETWRRQVAGQPVELAEEPWDGVELDPSDNYMPDSPYSEGLETNIRAGGWS